MFDLNWMGQAVLMVLSPLWFVVAYLLFVCLMPITLWLHRRYDVLVLVVLAGLAVIVDILRFRYEVPGVEWLNMIFVWGFAFQLGYFYGRISGVDTAPRFSDGRIDWAYQSARSRQLARMMALSGLVRADRAGVLRAVPGVHGRGARRGLEHGAADGVHRRADDLPGRVSPS